MDEAGSKEVIEGRKKAEATNGQFGLFVTKAREEGGSAGS